MVETVQAYSQRIVNSETPPRIARGIETTHDSMVKLRKPLRDVGVVLNDETAPLPLIVRKAMAEKIKLEHVLPGIWDGQIFAGCY
ncbi:MAG: hypothetical protein ACERKO_12920, partial [Acetanaerobacterium sp.]